MDTVERIKMQDEFRERVSLEDSFDKLEDINLIAGVDQAFPARKKVVSCIAVFKFPELLLIEKKFASKEIDFPYIPGLLSFREGPSVMEAYRKLHRKPDILLVDGHGVAHPRRIGLASHVGVELDLPTIGVAKNRLVGEFVVPKKVFEHSKLRDGEELIGYVLKTKENCRPLFVSPGHKVGFDFALRIVKECIRNHKLPEPLQLADRFVNLYRKLNK